jgi:hypothetical protein
MIATLLLYIWKILHRVSQCYKNTKVNHFNLCDMIWKIRIFERTPAIRNSGEENATDQKRWQISKNDLYRFDS